MRAQSLSGARLFVIPVHCSSQAPLSLEFFRQEFSFMSPFPPPGDLPNPGIKLRSPVSPAVAGRFLTAVPLGKHHSKYKRI